MSNWKRKAQRKQEIKKLNEEGAQAFRDGKHIQNMPAGYHIATDGGHWLTGYISERNRAEDNGLFKDDDF